MEHIVKGMLGNLGEQGVEKISSSVGLDSETTSTLMGQVTPLLLAKMSDNAGNEKGLASLMEALGGHQQEPKDRIDEVVNGEVDTKGSNILSHIFGSKKDNVVSEVAQEKGINATTMGKLFEIAGPLVLAQLGSETKKSNLGADQITKILGMEKQEAQKNNPLYMKLATSFLDKDNDGSVVDDVLGMASKFLFKGK